MNSTNGTHLTSDMDLADDNSGRPLTDNEEKVLYILNTTAGVLSMIGSFLILKIVRSSKKKKGSLSVYDRLLVGLSVSDFFTSALFWILGSYMMPKGDRVWAFGNDATCNITGWFGFIAFSSLLYSSMISLYYALLVRYGFRDDQLKGKIEYAMHLVCIVWPLISFTIVLILDAFGPRLIGLNCFLSDFPKGCVDVAKDAVLEEGEYPCKNDLTTIMAPGIPASTAGIVLVVCNLMIFCHVRSSIRQYQKKAFARWENATGFFNSPTEEPSSTSQGGKVKQSSAKGNIFRFGRKETKSTSKQLTREISNRDNQMQQVRAVMNQSLFYVGAMAFVNIPMLTQIGVGGNPSYTRDNESKVFIFLCFTTFMAPLQGVFNLLIFCRPTYLRMRKSFPTESRLQSFLKTLEAGTSDTRGGKGRRRGGPQLRSHPQPRKPIFSGFKNWKTKTREALCGLSFMKSDAPSSDTRVKNSTELNPSARQLARTSSNQSKLEYGDLEGGQDDDLSLFESGENDDDNDEEVIQLEMMDESSSSSPSSKSQLKGVRNIDDENAVPISPEVDDDDYRSGPYQDWNNIDFESSCVAFFTSTTSTIEA